MSFHFKKYYCLLLEYFIDVPSVSVHIPPLPLSTNGLYNSPLSKLIFYFLNNQLDDGIDFTFLHIVKLNTLYISLYKIPYVSI